MQEKPGRAGWVFGGIGAVLFALFMFYSINPRWFGERFIHFSGEVKGLIAVDPDRVLVLEDVQAGGGEDGPTKVGDRWRIVDVKTGKILVGPYYLDDAGALMVSGNRVLAVGGRGLEARDFQNKLLATLASFKGAPNLQHNGNDLRLQKDGSVTAMSDDGRRYSLNLDTLQATLLPPAPNVRGEVRDDSGLRSHDTTHVEGWTLAGRPRAQINGRGPDFLDPSWLKDPVTGKAIKAAGGYVMLHHLRMNDTKTGPGPMLSAVNADGVEAWRYVLPFRYFYNVAVMGDLMVIALNEKDDDGPGWLRVISLTTGQETWRLAL